MRLTVLLNLDGKTSSHRSHHRQPRNGSRSYRNLPAYSPHLNPQEHISDEIREKEFPNRVFADMDGVIRQLETWLPQLASDSVRLRSITAWPWIVSLILKAN